jgi:RNA polymerase sigma-70 factor (ECF subfamily)
MRRPTSTPLVEQLADHRPDDEPARHLAEELRRALARLRSEYRQAFLLFHQQQLSYAEIGAALDCPLGTVKTWVHRARREVIEALRRRGVIGETAHALP